MDLLTEYLGEAHVIQAQWTPALCLLEARRNKGEPQDVKGIVTYEGPIGCSVQEPVKSAYLIREIEKAC